MSVELNAKEVKALAERFSKMGVKGRTKLIKEVTMISYELVSYIKVNKLQGQVLHHRSGKLSGHVTTKLDVTDHKIESRVGVFAGVPYARIHEYGGTINRTKADGTPYHIKMPERSYLRSSLKEKSEGYAKRLLKVLK